MRPHQSSIPTTSRLLHRALHAARCRSSAAPSPNSLAEWAAGRKVERTLGPFVDRDGRLVWFDIFAIVRQVSLVRAPSSAPLLTLPLRGFSLGAATSYELPAGSVWILSRALSAGAPAGAYSGVRIKKGRLQLSSAPTIAGLTLTIPNGARVTLDLELDPPASAAPAATPGQDAHASRVKVPETATFVFTAGGGVLRAAGDASLKVFGAAFALRLKAAAATYEASLNRVLLPFESAPAELAIASSASTLFNVEGSAKVTLSAWALPVAVVEASQLGHASGAGALVLGTKAGLDATWRGLATNPGSPVALGPAFVLAETDRVVIVAADAKGVAATQSLRLWEIPNPGHAEIRLSFERVRLRFESLAGKIDAVLVTCALEAAVDRPVPVSGRRFTLRGTNAIAVLWDDGNASHALVQALISPPFGADVTALALRNALLTVSTPALLTFYGRFSGADQIESGAFVLFFRLLHFLFTLPDPYVTNQQMPGRFAGRTPATVNAPAAALVTSTVAWANPSAPQLDFALLLPGGQPQAMLANPPEQGAPARAHDVAFHSVAVNVSGANLDTARFPNPAHALDEDRQARQQLRAIFERAAGQTRESIALLDVSTNVDQFGVAWGLRLRDAQGVPGVPLQIKDLDVVSPGQNTRLFLLPQFQWEPVRNVPNPDILFFFPDRLVSGDDGSATLFGSNTVRLVPIRPDRILENLVDEFNDPKRRQPVGARFTLPFGIEAAAQFDREARRRRGPMADLRSDPSEERHCAVRRRLSACGDGAFTGDRTDGDESVTTGRGVANAQRRGPGDRSAQRLQRAARRHRQRRCREVLQRRDETRQPERASACGARGLRRLWREHVQQVAQSECSRIGQSGSLRRVRRAHSLRGRAGRKRAVSVCGAIGPDDHVRTPQKRAGVSR